MSSIPTVDLKPFPQVETTPVEHPVLPPIQIPVDPWPHITGWVVCIAVCLVILYDRFVWLVSGEEATVSSVFRGWCRQSPELIAALAILLWHLIGGR